MFQAMCPGAWFLALVLTPPPRWPPAAPQPPFSHLEYGRKEKLLCLTVQTRSRLPPLSDF